MPSVSSSFSNARALSSMFRSVNATFAPSCAYFKAIAFPIPRAAPVMTATFPSNSFIFLKFKVYCLKIQSCRILS